MSEAFVLSKVGQDFSTILGGFYGEWTRDPELVSLYHEVVLGEEKKIEKYDRWGIAKSVTLALVFFALSVDLFLGLFLTDGPISKNHWVFVTLLVGITLFIALVITTYLCQDYDTDTPAGTGDMVLWTIETIALGGLISIVVIEFISAPLLYDSVSPKMVDRTINMIYVGYSFLLSLLFFCTFTVRTLGHSGVNR